MIKRNKRSNGLDETTLAAANGRPAELETAPPDPDSETAWMADGNCRLHPPATFFPSDGVGVDRALSGGVEGEFLDLAARGAAVGTEAGD